MITVLYWMFIIAFICVALVFAIHYFRLLIITALCLFLGVMLVNWAMPSVKTLELEDILGFYFLGSLPFALICFFFYAKNEDRKTIELMKNDYS